MVKTKDESKRLRKETTIKLSVEELHEFTINEIERFIYENFNVPLRTFRSFPGYYGFRKRLQLFLLELSNRDENKHLTSLAIADLIGLQSRSLTDIRKGKTTRSQEK